MIRARDMASRKNGCAHKSQGEIMAAKKKNPVGAPVKYTTQKAKKDALIASQEKYRADKDRLEIMAPGGTKARLDSYMKANGIRSRGEALDELLKGVGYE